MNRIQRFCYMHRRLFVLLFFVSSCIFSGSLITGCGVPTWLSDAQNLVPVLVSGATSILGLIGAYIGGTTGAELGQWGAEVTTWGNRIEAGLKNVESLISAYKQNASDTLLQDIQQAISAVNGDISSFAQITGIPAAFAQKLEAWGQLAAGVLQSLASMLPVLSSHVAAGQVLTIQVPMTVQQIKDAFNAIVKTPTGDLQVDAALAHAKHL